MIIFLPNLFFGSDHRILLPTSALTAAILLTLCDGLARTIGFSVGLASEIPVGAVAALIGAPAFLVLLRRLR